MSYLVLTETQLKEIALQPQLLNNVILKPGKWIAGPYTLPRVSKKEALQANHTFPPDYQSWSDATGKSSCLWQCSNVFFDRKMQVMRVEDYAPTAMSLITALAGTAKVWFDNYGGPGSGGGYDDVDTQVNAAQQQFNAGVGFEMRQLPNRKNKFT